MPQDKKISQLNVADPLSGSELVPVVQAGETKAVSVQDIADLAGPGGSGAVDSVNGQTGVVVLDAGDIGAAEFNSYGWFDNFTQYDANNTNLSPTRIDRGVLGINVVPQSNTENESFIFNHNVLEVDTQNGDYGYNDNFASLLLHDNRFTHRNSGKIGAVVFNNHRLELGYNAPGGSARNIELNSNQVRLEQDYTVENLLKVSSTDLFVNEDATVQGFAVNQEHNLVNYGDMELSGYLGLRLHAIMGDNSRNGNVSLIQLGCFDQGNGVDEIDSIQGVLLQVSDTLIPQNGITAFSAFMGNQNSTPSNRKILLQGNGILDVFVNRKSQSSIFVDQANFIATSLTIDDSEPLSGTDYFSTLVFGNIALMDDMSAGPLGFGFVDCLNICDFRGAPGKTLDRATVVGSAMSVNSETLGGTITDLSLFFTKGAVDFGMTGLTDVTNLKAFHLASYIPGFNLGDNRWGLYIEDEGANNFLSKSLTIGSSTDVVDNDDIALQLSDKKALKLASMDETERDALNTSENMIILLDDGVTKKLQIFDGVSWVDL